jgi:hypothetical protein
MLETVPCGGYIYNTSCFFCVGIQLKQLDFFIKKFLDPTDWIWFILICYFFYSQSSNLHLIGWDFIKLVDVPIPDVASSCLCRDGGINYIVTLIRYWRNSCLSPIQRCSLTGLWRSMVITTWLSYIIRIVDHFIQFPVSCANQKVCFRRWMKVYSNSNADMVHASFL